MCHRIMIISCVTILLCAGINGQAQEAPTSGFAHFLYQSELYELAAEEFERLHFHDPQNLDHIFKLIECAKNSGQEKLINSRFQELSFNKESDYLGFYQVLFRSDMPTLMAKHYATHKIGLTPKAQASTDLRLAVLDRDWMQVQALSAVQKDNQSYIALNTYINAEYKRKKPALAGVLSGIVPGLGRIYAKDTKDGIFSFIFVASSGYQSYKRFKEKGTSSAGAWIYGGLSLGFYLGNIYGAYQSAKFYNKANDKKLFDFAYPQLLHSAYQS